MAGYAGAVGLLALPILLPKLMMQSLLVSLVLRGLLALMAVLMTRSQRSDNIALPMLPAQLLAPSAPVAKL